jgi:hypothetical protein
MRRLIAFALLLGIAGCGGGSDGAVNGTVTLDGNPLKNAVIRFMPLGDTKGLGGGATTDASGKYTLLNAQGGKDLAPGEYKIVVSRRLNKDGSEPDPNVPPIESTASETLPPIFSDENETTLRQTVAADKKTYDIQLETPKKK